MALSITVNGAGTFTASMEEGPVSFSASLAAVGPAGPAGATGPAGVVAATAPITYNAGTQTVGISATPTFTSVTATTGNLTTVNLTTATFADATSQTTAFVGEARKVYLIARNNTGSTIAKGKVVYLSGATGNKPTMALAQADAEATSARTIGILVEETANNADGKVIVSGAAENIDTSAFNDGDTLYLSATTAGAMTTSLPTQPLHGVVIGIVTRANPSVGSIEVAINNYQELEELSDVLISGEANNDLLAWDSTASVWKNRTFSTLGLLTSATAASTYAPIVHTHTASQISDSTTAGRALLTAADAAAQRTSLGLGTMAVETASDYLTKAGNLSGLASTSTARTNLGLGTMAVETATDYLSKAGNLSGLASNATSRTNLDVYSKSESDALVPAASTTVAGKVELATDAEAIAGTSTTLAVTPKGVDEAFLFPGRFLYTTAFGAATSGTGALTGQTLQDAKFIGAPTSAVGYALLRSAGALVQRGRSYNNGIDFSKRIVLAFRMALRTASTDANSLYRITLGKDTADNNGELIVRGFGIKGVSGSAVVLTVHNGTTLTNVNSTFTPSGVNSFDVELLSDGAGNVTLYIDGSQVATTSAGPSTAGGTTDYQLQAEAENINTLTGTRMGYEIANLRVTYSL